MQAVQKWKICSTSLLRHSTNCGTLDWVTPIKLLLRLKHLQTAIRGLVIRLDSGLCMWQLRDLYGPLLACVSATQHAFNAMVRQHTPDGSREDFVQAVNDDPEGIAGKAYRYLLHLSRSSPVSAAPILEALSVSQRLQCLAIHIVVTQLIETLQVISHSPSATCGLDSLPLNLAWFSFLEEQMSHLAS